MRCPKCKTEHSLLRDDDDNLYRRLCPCETGGTCHACAKGKVVVALLDRSGEVIKYACAKHGNDQTKSWTSGAQPKVEPKPEPRAPTKSPSKEKVKPAPNSNGVKVLAVPLYDCQCACGLRTLSTVGRLPCSRCGKAVEGALLSLSEMDHFQIGHGDNRTTIIAMMMIRGHGEYVPDALHITLPSV
jgi:hypothetical protein